MAHDQWEGWHCWKWEGGESGEQMAAEGRKMLGAEEERRERSCPQGERPGIRREPRGSTPNQENRGHAWVGPGVEQDQSYGEGLRGIWSGVRVGCLLLKSIDRQMDR